MREHNIEIDSRKWCSHSVFPEDQEPSWFVSRSTSVQDQCRMVEKRIASGARLIGFAVPHSRPVPNHPPRSVARTWSSRAPANGSDLGFARDVPRDDKGKSP